MNFVFQVADPEGPLRPLQTWAMFPKAATVLVYDMDDTSLVLKLRLRILDDRLDGARWAGAPALVSVIVEPNGPPREISTTRLRSMLTDSLVTSAVRAIAQAFVDPRAPLGTDVEATGAAAVLARRRRVVTEPLLLDVARVVNENPDAPTQAVADKLYCSYRTAGRWVKAARDAGLLPKLARKTRSK